MENLLLALPLGVAVGLSLGLVGAGGSLLAVPILVYILDQPVQQATTSTLFIVGVTALAGVAGHLGRGTVHWRVALSLGAVAILGAAGGTALNRLADEDAILFMLGLLMLAAAVALLRGRPLGARSQSRPLSWQVLAAGFGIGVLTGFFGVGGGFLIVPVLVLVVGLSIEAAIATSLVVIAIASAAALVGHLATGGIDWALTGVFTAVAGSAAVLGARLQPRVPTRWLTRVFAALVTVVGIFLIVKSLQTLL